VIERITPIVLAAVLGTATLNAPGVVRTLMLPPVADNSPVISLGTAVDPATGKQVEGWAIIHRRDNPIRPTGAKPSGNTCYGYLARGAKWKVVEPWLVNPTNTRNLDQTQVFNLLTGGVDKWEQAGGADVLGPGSATSEVLAADMAAPDGQNEVYFADINDANVIAVTIVWGIFGGPPSNRQLVEWDQIYDDVTFDWSAQSAGVAGKMDFDNIATHELGHSVGMADLYNTCVDETMYGYSAAGEIKKRDLNPGDITGINNLY
jgi:hypothetical protein